MESVVLASTLPKKIVPGEDEVEDAKLEDEGKKGEVKGEVKDEHNEDDGIEETENPKETEEGGQVEDDAGIGDGGGKDDEVEECTEGSENGDDPIHEEELENEVDDDNGDGEDEDNVKKEIVFDNDEVIKKAFQGDKNEMYTFLSRI